MSNTLVTPEIIAKRMLMTVRNYAPLAKNVYKDYNKEWEGMKKGQSINLRKPVKFTAQDGPTRVSQSITEETTPLTINFHKHVSFDWGVIQKTTSIEQVDERYMKPAAIALANALEVEIAKCYRDIYNYVGTAGTTPSSYETITQAKAKMSHEGVPNDGKAVIVLNPDAYGKYAYTISGLSAGVNQAALKALKDYDTGMLAGMKVYESQNVQTHDCGFATGDTIVTDGDYQSGSYIHMDGMASQTTIKYGDKFTLGATTTSVYACNPVSGASTGSLRCFTVSADATVASSEADVYVYPKVVGSGAYKSIVNADGTTDGIRDGVAVNEVTTDYVANLMYHPNAIALAMIPIQLPDSCSFKARSSFEGLSLAVTKAYDIDGFSEAVRIDMLAAIKTIQPEFGCVIMG